jgi:hypothetical protein
MRRGALALLLVASLSLAGCLGPSTAEWGGGADGVQVNFSMENTTVTSGLSGSSTTETLAPVGCTPGPDGAVLDENVGGVISFTGYLAASQFYTAHDTTMGARGLDFGVTTAVAIQKMTFNDAANVEDGDGARIDVKEWNSPLGPNTGAGSVDLDELDDEADSEWFILGLIPLSENVLNGMKSLNEWHQPVSVHGYMVSTGGEQNPTGYLKQWHTPNGECDLTVNSGNNREDVYVLVSGITLEGGTVSLDGEDDDEWVQGDVAFLGRGGFILFFLVGGLGGAVGLFIVSRSMVMSGASKSMQTLIGAEGMKKAASVKADAKAAKKAGMESPTERQERMDKQQAKEAKKEKAPPARTSGKDENPMGGFDLDSVLASTGSGQSGPGGAPPGGRKSSVVATDAAQSMDRMNAAPSNASSLPPSIAQRRTAPPPTTGNVATEPAPVEPAKKKPPVRRRKAVKPAEPVAESSAPAPQQHHEEEEEFSDFSF